MNKIAYYDALLQCGARYHSMLGATSSDALILLIDKFIQECNRGSLSIPKLCRWLGFIQANLISKGLTTVEAERNWTRPLFAPLDELL